MDKPKPQCWVCPGAAHVYDGHCDDDDDDVETSVFERIENGILHKYFMRNTGVKYPEELPTDAWRTIVNRPGSNGKQLDDRDNFDYSSLEPGTFVVHIPRTRGHAQTRIVPRRDGKWKELNKHLDNKGKVIYGYEQNPDGTWYWARTDYPPEEAKLHPRPNAIPDGSVSGEFPKRQKTSK